MRYIFFIQGEGRGHLTQALTLREKLEIRGHEVVAIIAGNSRNGLPDFFKEAVTAPIFLIDSPGFIVDKKDEGIRTIASALEAFRSSPRYFNSLKKIRSLVNEFQPDALVSFYEPLAGIYTRLWRDQRPLYCIAHQYFIAHPSWRFPNGDYAARSAFQFFNRLNAPTRAIKIALSFTAEKDQADKNLFIAPPLIRPVIKSQISKSGNFLLIYLLNSGYRRQIFAWSKKHPNIKLEAFSTQTANSEEMKNPALTFHKLSGQKFINRLAACRAYISTAGFDSIAEAAYLGKNIFMVPTKGHFEQKCNAHDAKRAGLAQAAKDFESALKAAEKQTTHSRQSGLAFREWVDRYDDKVVLILEQKT